MTKKNGRQKYKFFSERTASEVGALINIVVGSTSAVAVDLRSRYRNIRNEWLNGHEQDLQNQDFGLKTKIRPIKNAVRTQDLGMSI